MPVTQEVIGIEELRRTLGRMEHEVFDRAAARALNRTASGVRTQSVKRMSKWMGVKSRTVRDRAPIRKATPSTLTARIDFRGRPMNLIQFGAKQRKKGVSARPWGRRRVFPHTYIVDLGGGEFVGIRNPKGRGTQRRIRADEVQQGVDREPREATVTVVGPGVAETASRQEFRDLRQQVMRERFHRELEHEIDHRVQRMVR